MTYVVWGIRVVRAYEFRDAAAGMEIREISDGSFVGRVVSISKGSLTAILSDCGDEIEAASLEDLAELILERRALSRVLRRRKQVESNTVREIDRRAGP
jgi:hypothetical protein